MHVTESQTFEPAVQRCGHTKCTKIRRRLIFFLSS